MINKTLIAGLIAALLGPLAGAQPFELDTTPKPMTRQRADRLLLRPDISGPVKSLIPGEGPMSVDTLDTGNPLIKIVLFSDNTWKYVKDGDVLSQEDYFNEYWNERADAYEMDYSLLPPKVTLWLIDQSSEYCCPYQTKVYSKFGIRRGRRHQGVDLPLSVGTPVMAAFDGKVRIAKYVRGYGNLVVIRHPNGLETFYGHLSKILVTRDEWVTAGQQVGLGGSTGRSTGPHLHFESRYRGYAFDPQWLIDFETGTLRHGVFNLKKKYLSSSSRYVPESEDVEEEILIAEGEEREEAARRAAEEAAMRYHTIRSGDTLGGIARKYGTTVNQLCKWNNITPKTTLRIGRKIRVH